MLLPSIGLLGLVGMVVEGVIDRTRSWRAGPSRWAAIYTAAWIGGGHLVLSPLVLQATMQQLPVLDGMIARYGDALGDEPELAQKRVVVVNPPDASFTYYI